MLKSLKVFILLICVFLFTACNHAQSSNDSMNYSNELKIINVRKNIQDKPSKIELSTNETKAYLDFCELTKLWILKDDKNSVYSPMSLYYSLAALNEATSDEATKELFKSLLGNDYAISFFDKVTQNNNYQNASGYSKIVSAMWYDRNKLLNEAYINRINECLNFDNYSVDTFLKWARHDLTVWLDKNIKNSAAFFDTEPFVDDSTEFILRSYAEFESYWETPFTIVDGKTYFYPYLDSESENDDKLWIDFMTHTTKTGYYTETIDDITYQMTSEKLSNGNNLYIITSNSRLIENCLNWSLSDIINKLEQKTVKLTMPMGNFYESHNWLNVLDKQGYNQLLTSKYDNMMQEDAKLSYFEQHLWINFDVYKINNSDTSIIANADIPKVNGDIIDFVVDHPFVFYITDCENMPIYIGAKCLPKSYGIKTE